ncbi:MAG TPA: acetyl-CoA C-acetyltransferase [Chloroflexota bacterium]|nr:acetyl-CoA C-acetyltransferase [Chloroflexota bacterium]
MSEAYIVGAARTPIGRFLGALGEVPAPELGAVAVRAALSRAGVPPDAVDDVLLGNVIQAGVGQAPARQATLRAGIPPSASAMTLNKVCASGLQAAIDATRAIRLGEADIVVAGGMESMSLGPHLLPHARRGIRLGRGELVDATVHDGLWCAFEDQHMGNAAEAIAAKHGVTREAQDAYALASHQRAVAAQRGGCFDAEIVPVEAPSGKGSGLVTTDEMPRPDTSLERLAALRPAFAADGTVTAGNAPGLSDGAAAVVLASEAAVERYGLRPLARVSGHASAGIEPGLLFDAPPLAVRKVLERTGLALGDFDLLEVNEAFAAQVLANGRELGWDWERVNVHGGAIALGHPLGATGARILVTLLYALRERGGRRGLAALCHGGGGAVALAVEMV